MVLPLRGRGPASDPRSPASPAGPCRDADRCPATGQQAVSRLDGCHFARARGAALVAQTAQCGARPAKHSSPRRWPRGVQERSERMALGKRGTAPEQRRARLRAEGNFPPLYQRTDAAAARARGISQRTASSKALRSSTTHADTQLRPRRRQEDAALHRGRRCPCARPVRTWKKGVNLRNPSPITF